MQRNVPPLLNMTPDGRFRTPIRTPLSAKIAAGAVLVAVVTGVLAVGALFVWAALMLIPIAIGAAGVAYAAFRYQVWRARRT